jgi:hypothetical protein
MLSGIFKFKYEKGEATSIKAIEHVFEKGNVKTAISHAEKLDTLHKGKSPSDKCPHTRIHILVGRILKYAGKKTYKT